MKIAITGPGIEQKEELTGLLKLRGHEVFDLKHFTSFHDVLAESDALIAVVSELPPGGVFDAYVYMGYVLGMTEDKPIILVCPWVDTRDRAFAMGFDAVESVFEAMESLESMDE